MNATALNEEGWLQWSGVPINGNGTIWRWNQTNDRELKELNETKLIIIFFWLHAISMRKTNLKLRIIRYFTGHLQEWWALYEAARSQLQITNTLNASEREMIAVNLEEVRPLSRLHGELYKIQRNHWHLNTDDQHSPDRWAAATTNQPTNETYGDSLHYCTFLNLTACIILK